MAKKEKPERLGRNKYKLLKIADRLPEIEGWARDGARDQDICARLGIARNTFYDWVIKHPEFGEAIKKGKEVVDAEVENKLLNNAFGYEYWEETQEMKYNPITGQDEMTTVKRVLKHVKPETIAQIFWLKNRKPKEWRDKQHIEHEGAIGVKQLDYLSDEELDKALNELRDDE